MAEYPVIGLTESGSAVYAQVYTTFCSLLWFVAPVVSWAYAACARAALTNAPTSMNVMPRRNAMLFLIAPPRVHPRGGPILARTVPILPRTRLNGDSRRGFV